MFPKCTSVPSILQNDAWVCLAKSTATLFQRSKGGIGTEIESCKTFIWEDPAVENYFLGMMRITWSYGIQKCEFKSVSR
jgi:hypothetical protein